MFRFIEQPETLADLVHIECNSNSIMVTLKSDEFNGMIYPKGLSKNSSCMVEYTHVSNVTYTLPLRSCNTMSSDVVSFLPILIIFTSSHERFTLFLPSSQLESLRTVTYHPRVFYQHTLLSILPSLTFPHFHSLS